LAESGFEVMPCSGPLEGRVCPLLAGCDCPLLKSADVVVHLLTGSSGRAILQQVRCAGRPLVVPSKPGSLTPGLDLEVLPAGAGRRQLVTAVHRMAAGEVRRLRRRVGLHDGRAVNLRAVRASDANRLREFYAGLSENSSRLRFLGWMPPLNPDLAARMSGVDFRDAFAIVAEVVDPDGRHLVADCRLVPMPGPDTCAEIALVVADDYQGVGLGAAMLSIMVTVARDRGEREVVAQVRYDNAPMMHMLRALGFQRCGWDLGVVTFVYRPEAQPLATFGPPAWAEWASEERPSSRLSGVDRPSAGRSAQPRL
jgi:ribosomal protein S18 acetylase RimI-like enzyme